jgi:hypothetical protein
MAVSSLVIGAAWVVNQPRYEAAASELEQIRENPPDCFGALAGPDCQNPELAGEVIPGPGFGNADSPGHVECFVQLNESSVKACHFGSDAADAPRVALVGDSHAYQYIETLVSLAEDNGWSLTTYLKGACPWTTAPVSGPSPAFTASCVDWRANLADELAAAEPYDVVFTAALAHTPYSVAADDRKSALRDGFVEAWKLAGSAAIVTSVDIPDFAEDPNNCLRHSEASACTEPRDEVLTEPDPLALAGAAAGATVLDFTDKYCDAEVCFSVIGGANVYRDQDHLTRTFAQTLGPAIGEAIQAQLR